MSISHLVVSRTLNPELWRRSVETVVRSFFPIQHVRLPPSPPTDRASNILNSRLTQNYRFMIDHGFKMYPDARHLIVLEDDLEISVDAVRFFTEAANVMDRDSTIFCVSGYNDNGFSLFVKDSARVYRGQHFMALGWMTSRSIYETDVLPHWRMDTVWDVSFALQMGARHCIYPEVARTKHLGSSATPGALTTTASAQHLWFDHIFLNDGAVDQSSWLWDDATHDGQDRLMRALIDQGELVSCLWDMLQTGPHGSERSLLLLFQATNETAGQDEAWDRAAGAMGLMGRGGGWDRLPRGYYKGTMRTRVGGNMLVMVSSQSPYARSSEKLKRLLPFPPAPVDRSALVDGHCRAPDAAVTTALSHMTVFRSSAPCDHLCASLGKRCTREALWAVKADVDCSALEASLQASGDGASCSGCELDVVEAHAPSLDRSAALAPTSTTQRLVIRACTTCVHHVRLSSGRSKCLGVGDRSGNLRRRNWQCLLNHSRLVACCAATVCKCGL